MKKSLLLAFLAVALQLACSLTLAGEAPKKAAKPRQLVLDTQSWKGDFNAMLERRMVRVLVPYSRTLYYVDKGHERGLNAELARDLERYLNKKYAKQLGRRPLTVYLTPTTRDKLLPYLIEGRGDIVMANLTVTDERLKLVDFVSPQDRDPVDEVVATGPRSPSIKTVEDLSGRTVHVRRITSFYESVVALNERLRQEGKEPVKIVLLPDALEDEDKLEMLNAGLLEFVVIDDWKGEMWAQILPNIKIRKDLVLRDEGRIGWAIRKDSPELEAVLYDAYDAIVRKQGGIEARIARQQRRVKQITNNAGQAELLRFEKTVELFRKYGEQYQFDPLMLAAQGYQESQLRQEARSPVGAIGVMQIMPATGKDLRVGDITQIEPNIHGGAKYMDQLMTAAFPDANFSEMDRPLFAFASYNAGFGNMAKMRREAKKRGLDPDKWFNNVEVVVAEKIGTETTTYVRNIYKYYVAYKLVTEAQALTDKARENLEGNH